MQRILTAVAAVVVQVVMLNTPARADKLDVSTVTCAQLVESLDAGSKTDRYGMGGILYWIAGFTTTDEQGSVVDFGALGKSFDKILEECKSKPNVGVLSAAAKFLGENAPEHGAEAIDIATMTCEAAIKSSQDDEDGIGLILMWIAGYQASDSEDRIFDGDAFVADMKEVGTYCGANPGVGLLTASEDIMSEDEK